MEAVPSLFPSRGHSLLRELRATPLPDLVVEATHQTVPLPETRGLTSSRAWLRLAGSQRFTERRLQRRAARARPGEPAAPGEERSYSSAVSKKKYHKGRRTAAAGPSRGEYHTRKLLESGFNAVKILSSARRGPRIHQLVPERESRQNFSPEDIHAQSAEIPRAGATLESIHFITLLPKSD